MKLPRQRFQRLGRVALCVWLLGVLGGCGRLGFDDVIHAGRDATADADVEPSSPTFANLCSFSRYTIIENGIAEDDAVGAMLSSTLSAGCGTAATTGTVSQRDPGVLDPDSGRPLVGSDELVILGGGDGPHRALAYLLRSDTPVVWSGTSPATFSERASGRMLVDGPTSSDHDFALLMVVAEPIGGTRALSASGIGVNGTIAASRWFATEIAPTIATSSLSWLLIEWTNGDADPRPSDGDSYVIIGSG